MKKLLLLLMTLPAAALAQVQWGQFDFEYEADKPWVEIAAKLPAYPKSENLIEFNVSSATRNRHFVDANSISVDRDDVVRYTVVIEAAGGAKNIAFEGMRCKTGEYRIYAYGHADGTWSKARQSAWQGIKMRSLLSYHKALFEDHLCPDGTTVRNAQDAVRSFRNLWQPAGY
ncbi:MAG: CNP1-like family protein [Gammaproteobacteria bacterium]